MQLDVAELRRITEKLFGFLEASNVDHISLSVDYYWNIPTEEKYDIYNKPGSFDIGQISDDWQELLEMSTSEDDPILYNFVWLASVLRAVGETDPSTLMKQNSINNSQ